MEFLADECCDTSIVALLRADGHDVLFMQEQKPGLFDDEVLQIAYDEKTRKGYLLRKTEILVNLYIV